MKTIHIFILFILVAGAQIFIPANMIFSQETILETGTAYKFKTQPVDPSNPFKGKYIFLNYEINSVISNDSTWTRGETVFVAIANDSAGFVKVTDIFRDIPRSGEYVKVTVDWYDSTQNVLRFTFPFNEFYMNETKAYDAEVAHRTAQNDSIPNNTYALVYVKDGEAVLDNVFINDVPIAEYVE
jgi:uncharacterized membrane-anchored protein